MPKRPVSDITQKRMFRTAFDGYRAGVPEPAPYDPAESPGRVADRARDAEVAAAVAAARAEASRAARRHQCSEDCGPKGLKRCDKCGRGVHLWSGKWQVHDDSGAMGCGPFPSHQPARLPAAGVVVVDEAAAAEWLASAERLAGADPRCGPS